MIWNLIRIDLMNRNFVLTYSVKNLCIVKFITTEFHRFKKVIVLELGAEVRINTLRMVSENIANIYECPFTIIFLVITIVRLIRIN